jgi:ketosteroid isomerase-like protein
MQKIHTALLAVSLVLTPLLYGQQDANTSAVSNGASARDRDTADIERVMETFHQAVVAHDGERVASLFVAEGSTWFNVLSDEAFAAARAKTPTATKVRHSSFADFSKFVSTSTSALNPQHTNVQIHTDGTIASVYFDFVFLIDGKPQNRGSETWQLVKAADGWKIAAITYSSNPHA